MTLKLVQQAQHALQLLLNCVLMRAKVHYGFIAVSFPAASFSPLCFIIGRRLSEYAACVLQLNTFFAVTLPANGAFCNSSLFTAYFFDVAMHAVQLRSVIAPAPERQSLL